MFPGVEDFRFSGELCAHPVSIILKKSAKALCLRCRDVGLESHRMYSHVSSIFVLRAAEHQYKKYEKEVQRQELSAVTDALTWFQLV